MSPDQAKTDESHEVDDDGSQRPLESSIDGLSSHSSVNSNDEDEKKESGANLDGNKESPRRPNRRGSVAFDKFDILLDDDDKKPSSHSPKVTIYRDESPFQQDLARGKVVADY